MIEYNSIDENDDFLKWANQQLLLWVNNSIYEFEEYSEQKYQEELHSLLESLFPRTFLEDHPIKHCYSTLLDIRDVILSPLLQSLTFLQQYVSIKILHREIGCIEEYIDYDEEYDLLIAPMDDELKEELFESFCSS